MVFEEMKAAENAGDDEDSWGVENEEDWEDYIPPEIQTQIDSIHVELQPLEEVPDVSLGIFLHHYSQSQSDPLPQSAIPIFFPCISVLFQNVATQDYG